MGYGLNGDHVAALNNSSIQVYFSEIAAGKQQSAEQLLAGATEPGHRTSRHSLRIAIKKWRYFLEIVAPILDREITPFLELLKEYQSLLGRMNDVAEFEALLKKLKLPRSTRHVADEILKAEDAYLLEEFTALTRRKPLTVTTPFYM
jgi:CHAD domain-containing protein